MGTGNVELARRAYAAVNEGDVAAMLALLDPEIEWETSPHLPDAGVYRGHDGVRRLLEAQWEAWEGGRPTVEVEDVLEAGDDVLVMFRMRATGKASGLPIDVRIAHLVTMRDGLATRIKVYPDRAQALRAIGLEPGAPVAPISPPCE